MKTIDIRLKNDEVQRLKALIGTRLMSIQHDLFQFTPSSTQAVQLEAEGTEPLYLYSFTEPQDYYGSQEDVAVWSFTDKRYPMVEQKEFVKTPVDEMITGITLVQENQRLYFGTEQTDNVWVTRGIIFEFGEHQIAFEKAIWFSEEIYIHKGYDLIRQFKPAEDFCDDWEKGFRAECDRQLMALA